MGALAFGGHAVDGFVGWRKFIVTRRIHFDNIIVGNYTSIEPLDGVRLGQLEPDCTKPPRGFLFVVVQKQIVDPALNLCNAFLAITELLTACLLTISPALKLICSRSEIAVSLRTSDLRTRATVPKSPVSLLHPLLHGGCYRGIKSKWLPTRMEKPAVGRVECCYLTRGFILDTSRSPWSVAVGDMACALASSWRLSFP